MCGIVAILKSEVIDDDCAQRITQHVKSRGPTCNKQINVDEMVFFVSVLHIQGSCPCVQPLVADNMSVFCWNGEVFGGVQIDSCKSDTEVIFGALLDLMENSTDFELDLTSFLSQIQGPFAFILYNALSRKLYFSRDPFGRRSLVVGIHNNAIVCISSCGLADSKLSWREVPIGGVYKLDLCSNSFVSFDDCLIPWPKARLRLGRSNVFPTLDAGINHSSNFHSLIKNAILKRIRALNFHSNDSYSFPVGVLFSGGIDSVYLAAVLHLCLEELRENAPIDLINVTFEGPEGCARSKDASPDRLAAIAAFLELKSLFPTRQFRLVHVDVSAKERQSKECHIASLIFPNDNTMDLNIGTAFWFAARGQGYLHDYSSQDGLSGFETCVEGVPLVRLGGQNNAKLPKTNRLYCQRGNCKRIRESNCSLSYCKRCCVGTLKSNPSLKCAIHSIPLSKKQIASNQESEYHELLAENASISVIDCNSNSISNSNNSIPLNDLELPPNESNLTEETNPSTLSYTSSCRALLIGIGADEQMAGYGRHRSAYLAGGFEQLEQELSVDLARLWNRNLGRDDRCISDHGREGWFPFLDEDVVEFLQSLPLECICDMTLEAGFGDKKILRHAAMMIGLMQSCQLVKRAIQFGTRIAQHTDILKHGSHRKGKKDRNKEMKIVSVEEE